MIWEPEDSWESGYAHAEHYYRQHGDLNIPAGYITEDGYAVGRWIANQRLNAKGIGHGRPLTEEQKQRLEQIGMVWNPSETKWLEGYHHATTYLRQLNGARWKTNYISPDGYNTGAWIRSQARAYDSQRLSSERQRMLEQIGMRFDTVAGSLSQEHSMTS